MVDAYIRNVVNASGESGLGKTTFINSLFNANLTEGNFDRTVKTTSVVAKTFGNSQFIPYSCLDVYMSPVLEFSRLFRLARTD